MAKNLALQVVTCRLCESLFYSLAHLPQARKLARGGEQIYREHRNIIMRAILTEAGHLTK